MGAYHFACQTVQGDAAVGVSTEFILPDGGKMLSQTSTRLDPKTRIEMTFHPHFMGPDAPASNCVYLIEPQGPICKLTIDHYNMAPGQEGFAEGWARLAASLWIPYIVGVNTGPMLDGSNTRDFTRPGNPANQRPWVHRAFRAHLNLLEQFLPFAVLVLILDRMDGFSTLTAWAAVSFLCLRIAHAVGMITGIAGFPLRPILFTGGWVCCLILAYAALIGA